MGFDNAFDGIEKDVYFILYHDPLNNSNSGNKTLFFSKVRMNDKFESEREVVWWIYLVLGLMLFTLLIVCSFFVVVSMFFSKEDGNIYKGKAKLKSGNEKSSDSMSLSESQPFETKGSNHIPDPLDNRYLKTSENLTENK